MSNRIDLDLGDGHTLRFFMWAPNRDLNPRYAGMPDVERAGCTIWHSAPSGDPCEGALTFDLPETRHLAPDGRRWQVESWDPLTISPSVLCHCGDHGFVRGGKWVRA